MTGPMNTESRTHDLAAGISQNGAALDAAPGTEDRLTEAPTTRPARGKSDINWFRFWMRMLVAMIVFNVVAGLFTWYVLFPKLHPVH